LDKACTVLLPRDPNEEVVEERPEATTDSIADPKDIVWLLEPPNSTIPSCIIVFMSFVGLGQFPNIAYSQLLTRPYIESPPCCSIDRSVFRQFGPFFLGQTNRQERD
jgi:hypothetical protein